MDMENKYLRPPIPESKRFFAKRVREWVLHPENDNELTEEIRNGEHPDLEILLETGDEQGRNYRLSRDSY